MSTKPNLSDRLLRYSAAASIAAGGLMITGPRSIIAETDSIVDPEPDVTISALTTATFPIDFDGDAEPEFVLNAAMNAILATSIATDVLFIIYGAPMYFAALNHLDLIGPTANWVPAPLGFLSMNNSQANWINLDPADIRYLGVQYVNSSTTAPHFAWVELSIKNTGYDAPGSVPELTIYRYGSADDPFTPIPADVTLTQAGATGGLQTIAASAFAVLSGALTWIRRKLRNS